MTRAGVALALALLLSLALAGPAAAQQSGASDRAAEKFAPEVRAERPPAVAEGVTCDSECVMAVQRQLQDEGLYRGPADGRHAAETEQALRRYQSRKGLQPTGEIDERVLASLNIKTGRGGQPPESD